MIAVDGLEPARIEPRPQPLTGVAQPAVCVVGPFGELGVAGEQPLELCGELSRSIGNVAA